MRKIGGGIPGNLKRQKWSFYGKSVTNSLALLALAHGQQVQREKWRPIKILRNPTLGQWHAQKIEKILA